VVVSDPAMASPAVAVIAAAPAVRVVRSVDAPLIVASPPALVVPIWAMPLAV
jgi:hypothetical protein